VLTSLRCIFL